MAHISKDRVWETTTTAGAGAQTLLGALDGTHRTFGSVMTSPSDTCMYMMRHRTASEWEGGIGTYSATNTLTRTTPLSSSNGGSTVTFSAGTIDIFMVYLADRTPIYTPLQAIQHPALTSDPETPASTAIAFYARKRTGFTMPEWLQSSGKWLGVQPHQGYTRCIELRPEAGTTIRFLGWNNTTTGTVSHPALASTNMSTAARRSNVISAAGANSSAELRSTIFQCWRGNAARLGGFFFSTRFNLLDLPTNVRALVGLCNQTTALSTSLSPLTQVDTISMAFETGETNWRLQYNDGSGNCTRVDLGANFPVNATAVYTLTLFCFPNDSSVYYEVQREDSLFLATGTLTTDIPSTTTFLAFHTHVNNGGTAAACSFDTHGAYINTDY